MKNTKSEVKTALDWVNSQWDTSKKIISDTPRETVQHKAYRKKKKKHGKILRADLSFGGRILTYRFKRLKQDKIKKSCPETS